MAKFGTAVQTRDMHSFQTLGSLKLEPRLDPKSTRDNGSLLTVSKDIRPLYVVKEEFNSPKTGKLTPYRYWLGE